jgi:hypothetical protein
VEGAEVSSEEHPNMPREIDPASSIDNHIW